MSFAKPVIYASIADYGCFSTVGYQLKKIPKRIVAMVRPLGKTESADSSNVRTKMSGNKASANVAYPPPLPLPPSPCESRQLLFGPLSSIIILGRIPGRLSIAAEKIVESTQTKGK